MRVGPVAFDQLQLGGRTFGGRSLGILMACIGFDFGLLIHWPLQLQLDHVLDYGFLHFRLQFCATTWLFSVECPGFRGSFSRELLWKINSRGC